MQLLAGHVTLFGLFYSYPLGSIRVERGHDCLPIEWQVTRPESVDWSSALRKLLSKGDTYCLILLLSIICCLFIFYINLFYQKDNSTHTNMKKME